MRSLNVRRHPSPRLLLVSLTALAGLGTALILRSAAPPPLPSPHPDLVDHNNRLAAYLRLWGNDVAVLPTDRWHPGRGGAYLVLHGPADEDRRRLLDSAEGFYVGEGWRRVVYAVRLKDAEEALRQPHNPGTTWAWGCWFFAGSPKVLRTMQTVLPPAR